MTQRFKGQGTLAAAVPCREVGRFSRRVIKCDGAFGAASRTTGPDHFAGTEPDKIVAPCRRCAAALARGP
jgi:hypothetical protein